MQKLLTSKLDKAFDRIFLDNSRFDGYKLSEILLFVWNKIHDNENLKERLLEELIDSNDTCSSGYFTRLMNVFSGTEFSGVKISVDNEIYGSVCAEIRCYH